MTRKRRKGVDTLTREKIYVNEFQPRIPEPLNDIIREKAKREGMSIRLAAGMLFEILIAGERNKRRAYDGLRYMVKQEKKGKGQKLPYKRTQISCVITFEDTDFVAKFNNGDLKFANSVIGDIMISWFNNDNWKSEVLDKWL